MLLKSIRQFDMVSFLFRLRRFPLQLSNITQFREGECMSIAISPNEPFVWISEFMGIQNIDIRWGFTYKGKNK